MISGAGPWQAFAMAGGCPFFAPGAPANSVYNVRCKYGMAFDVFVVVVVVVAVSPFNQWSWITHLYVSAFLGPVHT